MYYGFKNQKEALLGIIAVVAVIFVLNLFHVFNIFSCNPFANQAQVRFYDEIEPVNRFTMILRPADLARMSAFRSAAIRSCQRATAMTL